MGMFDYINYEMDCPDCGALIAGFQSKSGPCELKTLHPTNVDEFYAGCDNCKTWVTFVARKPPVHTKFKMYVGFKSAQKVKILRK